MITEVVEILLKQGMVEQFIAGARASRDIFERSPGFISFEVHRIIENPSAVMLFIQWESVAHHMDMFRNSPEYLAWRANVGDCFAEAPRLQHTETVINF